jgi:hypothetical protein
MNKLTKEGLKNCAFYCAAGIDLQPLLRFGDIVSDFIYASIDIKKKEFIEGIKLFVDNLNKGKGEIVLEIISISDFQVSDIEHPKQNRVINKVPEYMNSNDYKDYLDNFNRERMEAEHYNLHINFTLKIGNIVKSLNLFHITGEALATYEALFVRQNIAPKIFISIQTGLIEIPSRFTNTMFESHSQRPKVWIRGVWTDDPWNQSVEMDVNTDGVFTPFGLYNKKIGEFRNWDSQMGVKIDGTTDPSKKYRVVRAYGESEYWNNTEKDEVIIEMEGIKVRKLFKSFNSGLHKDYAVHYSNYWKEYHQNEILFIEYPQLPNQLNSLKYNNSNYLDRVYQEYVFFANNYSNAESYNRASMPYGSEAEEGYISTFIKEFQIVNDIKLHLDIYYRCELDFNRDF